MRCDVLGTNGRWHVERGRECAVRAVSVARTMIFVTLAFAENLRVLSVRSFHNHLFHGLAGSPWMLGGACPHTHAQPTLQLTGLSRAG